MADFEAMYSAISARDRRFDGQFVTAVRTTGIYCRPSCPATRPKRRNVEFFPTTAAAQVAGYRACLRCLPEATPGSPLWHLGSSVADRAMRLIEDGVVDDEGVAGLASRLGYTTRHVTRLLVEHTGAGPLAHARARRARVARQLLTATDVPVTDVGFAAGFASVRQFNETIRDVYALSPTQLRARGRHPAGTPGTLRLTLPYREPLDWAGLLAWFGARAIPGVEAVDGQAWSRVLALPGGPAVARVEPGQPAALALTLRLTDLRDCSRALGTVRRLLDLDADPVAVDAELSRHAAFAPLVAATPGIRIPGVPEPTEALVRALVGQQVTVAAARRALIELVASRPPVLDGELTHAFPTAAEILAADAGWPRGPASRRAALRHLLAEVASGELRIGVGDDPDGLRARLGAYPGVGAWTAAYVALRVLQAPDIGVGGDRALLNAAAARHLATTERGLAALLDDVRPWRSYACLHLWRSLS